MPPADPPFDLYERPELYDILFRRGSARTVRGLERVAAGWMTGRGTRRWLEPACGTGRLLVPAARRGHLVSGFDRSPRMVAWARRRLQPFPGSRVVVADMRDADRHLPAGLAGFAFNLDNSLRHLRSRAEIAGHLNVMRRLIRPGGAYIIGLSFHDPRRAGPNEDIWTGRRGRTRVTQMLQFDPPPAGGRERHESVIEHVEVEGPAGVERHDARWRLLLITLEAWRRIVADSPFAWVATLDEGARPIEPGVFDSQWLVLSDRRAASRRRARSTRATSARRVP